MSLKSINPATKTHRHFLNFISQMRHVAYSISATCRINFHTAFPHRITQITSKKPQSSLQNFYICIMEIDEEKYRQFTEKLEKELQERRAIMELEKLSIAISVCGIIFGAIPYFGWLYLFFSFGYCCYAFKKTWSSLAFTSIIICILMLFVKYCLATID